MIEEIKKPKEPAAAPAHHGIKRQRTMLVRYGKMGLIGIFHHTEREIPTNVTHVVIQTERGLEIGEIVSPFCHNRGFCTISQEKIDRYCTANGPDYTLNSQGRVVRFATTADLNEQRHLDKNSYQELSYCQNLIEELNLPMKLVGTEHLFGGDRIIYYFMADGRVDFRELVKTLAREYQTHIEMRQIGARDEARLIADFETCGRECCCKNFLKVLQPVNMRMAKQQKATLDPSKISGRCGRLKCCLRYEDEVYSELVRKLPRKGSVVLTEQGAGTVADSQIITQLVKINLDNGSVIAINVDEILEQNYHPKKPAETQPGKPVQAGTAPSAAESPPPAEPVAESSGGPDAPKDTPERNARKRRRRRRKKKFVAPDNAAEKEQNTDRKQNNIDEKQNPSAN